MDAADQANIKEQKQAEQPAPRKKRRIFRRILKYFSILLLIILLAATAGTIWLTQSQGGQKWLVDTANSALAAKPGQKGPTFKITSLRGSLPFNFQIGLEGYDEQGLWLSAPQNIFRLNWKELPGKLHIEILAADNVDLQRFPITEPTAPEPPKDTPPVGLREIQSYLADAVNYLASPPWWLPEIAIDGVKINALRLPEGLLPDGKYPQQRLLINAGTSLSLENGVVALQASTTIKNYGSEPVSLQDIQFRDLSLRINMEASPSEVNRGLKAGFNLDTIVNGSSIVLADLPGEFLGDRQQLSIRANADIVIVGQEQSAAFTLAGPNLEAGHVKLANSISWKSGIGWRDGTFDGPLNLDLNLDVEPCPVKNGKTSPVDMLQAPAALSLQAKGDLPNLDLALNFDCDRVTQADHVLENIRLAVNSPDLVLPLDGKALAILENEHNIHLNLGALLDREQIEMKARCFFQKLPAKTADETPATAVWRAGLADLNLDALGIKADGALTALLPPEADPGLNGGLKIAIANWKGIGKFVPDNKFSGDVLLSVDLSSATTPETEAPQDGKVQLDIKSFVMKPKKGEATRLGKLTGNIALTDIFKNLAIDARIDADGIRAAGMAMAAQIRASGPVAGPLTAQINSNGDISAKIAAQWSPGKAQVRALDLKMKVPGAAGSTMLGLNSRNVVEISYGEDTYAVRNLDLDILPSGKLRANGGLSPGKIDFDLVLDNLVFKPWQALVAQIPEGSASARINLKGAADRPQGNFRVAIQNVKIPKAQIAPISATISGGIENLRTGSALKVNFQLDPQTVKALGGSVALINASLPLIFGKDGIPKPDMNGRLTALVRWDGALGPIWQLVPVADQRLNGRVDVYISAGGTLGKPRISGGINVNKARYENIALGVLVTDINVKLDLYDKIRSSIAPDSGLPGGMKLDFSASDGRGGTIKVNGSGALNGNDLDIQAQIKNLKPLRRRDVHIELSGQATVTGQATAPVVNGEIIVNQGEVLLDNLVIGSSVTTLPITTQAELEASETAKPVKAEPKNQGSLNIAINMLPRFTVEGRGLTSLWKANMRVEGTPENPQITGNVSSVKGNFDFLGKNFVLTRGIVTFAGGAISDPLLDIEMTNETPDLTAHFIISGPVSDIKFTLTSEPQMPRDEILSHVLFGRDVNDLSRLEALQLAAAVAQLAGFGGGNSLLNIAKKTLGVDVLRVGSSSGNPGDETDGGATIEMGKYINDMIYMGVQQGMKADSTAFIIQLELTPRTNIELRSEQNNTWGGLKWKYNY